MIDDLRHLGACRGAKETMLVAPSLVMGFLQIFHKQYTPPLSPQAASRSPLMVSMSICKTKQKLVA